MIKIIKLEVNKEPTIINILSKNIYTQLHNIVHGTEYNYPILKNTELKGKYFLMVDDSFGYNLTDKKLKKYYNKYASNLTNSSEYGTCIIFKSNDKYCMSNEDFEFESLTDEEISLIFNILNKR